MTDVATPEGLKGKFTFKKGQRATGLAAVGSPNPDTNIKIGGKFVGYIGAPHATTRDHWMIAFATVAPPGNSMEWSWIFLSKKFQTEPEAREFVLKNADTIQSKWALYALDGYEH
jgi:hypothetical protein